jgi:hypothetical protein
VIAILLVAIVLLLQRQAPSPVASPIGCGAAEDTLRGLIALPSQGENWPVREEELEHSISRLNNEQISRGVDQGDYRQIGEARSKVTAFVGINTGYSSVERRKALRKTWLPSTPDGLMRYNWHHWQTVLYEAYTSCLSGEAGFFLLV